MYTSFTRRRSSVTPCVGVWIETHGWQTVPIYVPSHPAWVCGLKHVLGAENIENLLSHPAWVCGLKQDIAHSTHTDSLSHPAWVCGLKHIIDIIFPHERTVTPCVGVWIETKPDCQNRLCIFVTPCVGVWIETLRKSDNKESCMRHTLRGCVD